VDPSYKWAGGGLLSTAEDLVRFGAVHLAPGYFEERTLETLLTSQTTLGGDSIGVGLGWRVGQDDDGHRLAWHAGNMAGARSILLLDRDRQGIVALLSNTRLCPYFIEDTAQACWSRSSDESNRSPAEPVEEDAECPLSGTYEYEFAGGGGGEADGGTLHIECPGPPFGTMTLPASIAAIKEAGVPAPLWVPIMDVQRGLHQARVLVVTSAGALTLRLRTTETGMEGFSIGLFTERSIVGTRTDTPACSPHGIQ